MFQLGKGIRIVADAVLRGTNASTQRTLFV
jgi:hypothetical protein